MTQAQQKTNDQAEHEEHEQDDQELDTRPQDVVEDDHVKIPKEDYKKQQKALKEANKQAHKLRERYKAYEELGDPEELQELRTKIQQMEEGADKQTQEDDDRVSRKEMDKLRQRLQKEYEQQIRERDEKLQSMQSKVEQTVLISQAKSIIQKYDGKPELGLLDKVKGSAKVIEENGEFNIRMIDEDGDPVFNDKGEYANLEDFVKGLREDPVFGQAFNAPRKTGTGVRNQNDNGDGGKRGVPNVTKSELNRNEAAKKAFFEKHGFEGWKQLKD